MSYAGAALLEDRGQRLPPGQHAMSAVFGASVALARHNPAANNADPV
jgi:hypothetical protein